MRCVEERACLLVHVAGNPLPLPASKFTKGSRCGVLNKESLFAIAHASTPLRLAQENGTGHKQRVGVSVCSRSQAVC